jgi:gamma-glutamyltranspeptidase/glutathione hydrolase
VVDADGNAVALIQSLYEAFGSCTMVPATGMVLHNRARGFTLDASHPNVLAPNKRPYHTLHPAMILKDDRPAIILGTPGADGQTQTNIQVAMDLIDFEADPQQAAEAPRWRSNPDGSLMVENRFPEKTIAALKAKGHHVHLTEDYAEIMGSSQVIMIDPENGVLKAGADPRRQAYAIGK